MFFSLVFGIHFMIRAQYYANLYLTTKEGNALHAAVLMGFVGMMCLYSFVSEIKEPKNGKPQVQN